MIRASRNWIANHGPSYLHGGAWKLAALACKFVFLIYFVPRMLGGEFAKFLFVQSAALLLARAASVGMVDELPVRIRGDTQIARQFWPLLRFLQVISLGGLAIAWISDSLVVAGLELVLVLVAEAILEGVIRTLQQGWFERALNWPWLIFIALLVAGPSDVALDTLRIYVSALVLSQLAVTLAIRPMLGSIDDRRLVPEGTTSLVKHGSMKMFSELTLLANTRGPVLLPVVLVGSLQSDQMSLSLAIADALASLFMVIVNRNYVHYCRNETAPRQVIISASFVIVVMTLLGVVALMANEWMPTLWPDKLNGMDLLWAFVFFGAITAYQDLRYFFWARGAGVRGSINVQLCALIVQVGLVLVIPSPYQLPTMAIAMALGVLSFMGTLKSPIFEPAKRE